MSFLPASRPAPTLACARHHAHSGDLAAAENCYRAVLVGDPGHAEARYRLALLLQRRARHHEALHLLGEALAVQPDNPVLHATEAASFVAVNRPLDALESMAAAIRLQPGNLDHLYNLGHLYAELCCPAQAEVIASRVLQDRPDWPAARLLRVRALTGLETGAEVIAADYDFLIKSDPFSPALRFARGLQHLRDGNYRDGWEAQELRWQIEPVKSSAIVSERPRWAGGNLAGRRLLVLGEQGHGDILQFSRYLPLLRDQGAHVTLRLDRERAGLCRLLDCLGGLDIVVDPADLPPHDLWCPLASLPWIVGTHAGNMPPPSRFCLDPSDVADWQSRLLGLPRPWIGICWAGSGEHHHDLRRSLPLAADGDSRLKRLRHDERMASVAACVARAWELPALESASRRDALTRAPSLQPLLERCGGSFVSLQIGPAAAEADDLPPALRSRVARLLERGHDFYDTATLLANLDAVVTVDTSVAHLAGSSGRPTVMIKPDAPEWRWTERDGSALWYPGMLLVTQDGLARAPDDIARWACATANSGCSSGVIPG